MNELSNNKSSTRLPSNVPTASERSLLRGRLHYRKDELRQWTVEDVLDHVGVGRFHALLFVLCGALFMSDAAEVMLLGFLQKELRHEWSLSPVQAAYISASVFAGELAGACVGGILADTCGRRTVCVASSLVVAGAGYASSAATCLPAICILRFCVGAGVGTFTVPFDLLAEFTPVAWRGRMLIGVMLFWGCGQLLTCSLAWWLLPQPRYGWRALLVACAVPATVAFVAAFIYLPESPRYLAVRGRYDEAAAVLRRSASTNGVTLPSFAVLSDMPEKVGVKDVLGAPALRSTTLALWWVWAAFGYSQYGLLVLSPDLFPTGSGSSPFARGAGAKTRADDGTDFAALFCISCAAIPGYLLLLAALECMPSRRPLLAASFGLGAAVVWALAAGSRGDAADVAWRAVLCACALMSLSAASSVAWLYTCEVYPTTLRTTAHAMANAFARLGAMLAPLAAPFADATTGAIDAGHTEMTRERHAGALIAIATSCLVGFVASLKLVHSTHGKVLRDTLGNFG